MVACAKSLHGSRSPVGQTQLSQSSALRAQAGANRVYPHYPR
jgi:hypothetical protein